jgi:hypothetical protein
LDGGTDHIMLRLFSSRGQATPERRKHKREITTQADKKGDSMLVTTEDKVARW